MLEPDEIIQQQDLLKTHRITLYHCLKQQAMLGKAYAPPAISHCIDEARKEIHRIKFALRSQGVQVDDHIDDDLSITFDPHREHAITNSIISSIVATNDGDQAGDGLDLIHRPWRSRWHIEGKPELYAYKSPNGFDGVCRVERIDLSNGQVVIICEQIDGNPGLSITNAVEYIAPQICDQYEIDPQDLIWIEHYDTWFSNKGVWKLVNFATKPPRGNFADPKWKEMTKKDWQALGLQPNRNRTQSKGEPGSLVEKYRRRNS